MKPLAIDLFCGLGGWTDGLLAEGYTVVGFDIERHIYGEERYPAQLVLQDVLTIDGRQFKDAALIVASPPCQAYSYRAMPWKRAKALPPPDNTLFEACFRIQREASVAAGQHIPLVVENVCGAQKWVGRARWHYGSFYLWGDVPALMPITNNQAVLKAGVTHRSDGSTNFHGQKVPGFKGGDRNIGRANGDHQWNTGWFAVAHNTTSGHGQNPDGRKHGGDCFNDPTWAGRQGGIKRDGMRSSARAAASARIAKIPFELARHIARAWKPTEASNRACVCEEGGNGWTNRSIR